jgi:hypothetical protein
MSNCVFGFPDYGAASPLNTPAVTGSGGWLSTLPRANVLDRRLSRIARSVDTNPSNTQLLFDLGIARSVGVLSILIPNLTKTTTPTIQWEGASDAGFSSIVYNSGTLQAWPTGVTAEDVVGPDGTPMNVWSTHIPAAAQTARYWAVIISDTANVDGHVDVARVIIAGAYRPTRRISAGAKSSLENDTVRTETDGGATLYKARATRRVDTFSVANTPESEALTTIRRMQHRLGTSGQLFWVFDEADPYLYERSFAGTLRQLGALEYPDSMLYNTVGFEIVEDL